MELLAHIDTLTGKEQTLRKHCARVSKLCGDSLRSAGLTSLGQLVGLLHDMGKATRAFQDYLRNPAPGMRGKINHSSCGARFLAEEFGIDTTLAGLTATLGAAAICGHHSGLPDCTSLMGEDVLHQRIFPSKEIWYDEAVEAFTRECVPKQRLFARYQRAKEEVIALYKGIYCYSSSLPEQCYQEQRAFFLGLTARLLESSLVDADRYDTYRFQAKQMEARQIQVRTGDKFLKADRALWVRLSERLEDYLTGLPNDTPINQIRGEISNACRAFAERGPGIYQLNVPTGGGKTLASLRFALHTAQREDRRIDHIFYIAPFRVILEQNAEEIRCILKEKNAILEHHGSVVPDKEDSSEDSVRYQLLTQRWNAPMVFTTMVQFLQTLFSARQGCTRRFQSLQNSVILLDEVQSVPVKFVSMLNSALNFLSGILGCTVILCTATQPELAAVPVPVLLSNPALMVPRELTAFSGFQRTRVVDKSAELPMDAPALASFVAQQQEAAGSVLVILNTKAAALRLYRSLKSSRPNLPVYYLTTSLCPQNRIDILGGLRRALDRREPLVCVSTQLIEAGVDISFGCVIRSLAGLDSIAQAAGRCNRHGELGQGNVFIIKSADEDLSYLPDIKQGQNAAIPVLNAYRGNPGRFSGSLLSPEAIQAFYLHYYHDRKWELDYPVSREKYPGLPVDATLYSLLSINREARRAVVEQETELPSHILHQAFATAGRVMEVFDSDGIDVLVPYGEGEEIIAALLRQDLPCRELPGLLRRAQRFLVHLFLYEKWQLEEQRALVSIGDGRMLALDKRFYDEKLGVQMQRGELDLMLV